MPSACNALGIIPNPDISGIGVRAAIYAQAVLTLVQPILASMDGHISEKELIGLHRLYLGILLPGCALLVSAIIQARTEGLSVYHATIVLQLSWINNTSALIFFQFALIAQIGLDKEHQFRQRVGKTLQLLYKMLGQTIPKDQDRHGSLSISDTNGIRPLLKERSFILKAALSKKDIKFQQSRDILDEVVQNLSALRAAITDDSEQAHADSEVAKAVTSMNKPNRLFNSLGIEMDSGSGAWWKIIGRVLRLMIGRIMKPFPQGERVAPLLSRDWIMATLASAHLTLFAAFGVWVWSTIDNFGNCDSFTRDTRIDILPQVNIRVTSPIRFWFIVLYIICLIPYLNIVFIGGLEFLAVSIVRRMFFPKKEFYLASFIVLTLLVQAYFIVTTELTIRANRRLLVDSSQEGNWTFGQTLAVALVAIPLIDVVTQSWKERNVVRELFRELWSLVRPVKGRSDPNEVHEINSIYSVHTT